MTTLRSVRRRLRQFFQAVLRLTDRSYDEFNLDKDLELFFAGKLKLRWDPYSNYLVFELGDFK